MPLLVSFAALLCAPAPVPAAVSEVGAPSSCSIISTVGTDTTGFSGTRRLSPGRGYAQSFMARDTLVRSIALWLPGYQRTPKFGLHLWITRAGADGRPRTDQVVADGGTLTTGGGQGMTAARFQFEFVPPIALPERGHYAVVVVADRCGVLDVLTSAARRRGAGDLFETSLRGCGSGPGTRGGRVGEATLAFHVEFCDLTTAAHGRTWGEIKTVYR